jgi:hypothetical protein
MIGAGDTVRFLDRSQIATGTVSFVTGTEPDRVLHIAEPGSAGLFERYEAAVELVSKGDPSRVSTLSQAIVAGPLELGEHLLLAHMITAARSLNAPASDGRGANFEYTRGQAELIRNLIPLHLEPDLARELVMRAILGEPLTVEMLATGEEITI